MSLFSHIKSTVEKGIEKAEEDFDEKTTHSHHAQANNRFRSFAPPRTENDAKWFIDGCGYMWAVSVAIEEAKESIWILDWWLSPELYLRRPPSANENYRLDRMLLAAAKRGVKVNIIVYKEVSGILTLCSEHTKKALEIHPNISVFRHPDHAPSSQSLQSQLISGIKNFSFKTLDLAKLPGDGLKAIYGASDIILYWAHHEKLCLIDGKIAFMGGLDLCYGRWDTNAHPIADAHPTDVDKALFPGQDFNNARVYDFEDVSNYMNNKLDRTKYPRMGWSDISLCLQGPVIDDLRAHFVQRWNFIFKEKYDVEDNKYPILSLDPSQTANGYYKEDGSNARPLTEDESNSGPGAAAENSSGSFHLGEKSGSFYDTIRSDIPSGISHHLSWPQTHRRGPPEHSIQLVRSCTQWSNGVPLEHSIANAYIEVIRKSQYYVYIENQFFITATGDDQHPVKNQLGAALVERIIRAHQNGENYKVIVCVPSIPGFAGDLHADDSLGTRAIMEYQYNSICRGGHSIMEEVQKAGVPDAKKYIRFYNLRNYDRINAGETMSNAEKASGVSFEDARKQHDDIVGAGYGDKGEETGAVAGQSNAEYDHYQQAASKLNDDKNDSVCECYMDGGPSLKDVPWSGSEEAEMDAFVSEELYIHSKVLIADDRVVICGSANLNDRSQLGSHDSEIAVVIEDPTPVDSAMAGQPFQASKYAASLRRQLFRKHLGLLPWQDWTKPNENFTPINKDSNIYDWGSPADLLVRDPLSHEFANLWDSTAKTNREVFNKAFHSVPTDKVRTWEDYETYYQKLFISPTDKNDDKEKPGPKYLYGHVVKEEFPGGVSELKDWLGKIRGALVEMPLLFMDEVDFAKEGLKLNAFTDEVYT